MPVMTPGKNTNIITDDMENFHHIGIIIDDKNNLASEKVPAQQQQ